MLQWFVARTKPQLEFYAQANLRAQSYDTFLPTYLTDNPPVGSAKSALAQAMSAHKQHALSPTIAVLRPSDRLAPLFPRYLFVRFDPSEPGWPSINSTRGIVKLLATPSGAPIPVPARIMSELLGRATPTGQIEIPTNRQTEKLPPNTPVTIIAGSLANSGIEAIFKRYTDDGLRAVLFLRILGGIEAKVDPSAIEAA